MGYSIEASSDSCYPNTTCLINKFDIKDDKKLSQIEAEITFAKAALLESEEIKPPFDFEFYKSIHRFLFEDLYEWAGELRKADISKKGMTAYNHGNHPPSLPLSIHLQQPKEPYLIYFDCYYSLPF